ncbi:MAG: rod shape-determining protein MreD [Lachnospiraceae bacterium]|nr:rod shape-determining protein MreD [Lachnospiraceae bacterium]
MIRKIIMVLGAFVIFLLQNCVFTQFNTGGIVPNLILLITGIYGFMHGEKAGLIAGFLLGLGFDIFYGDIIGLHALIFMYIGYINGKFCGIYYPEDIKLPLLLIFLSNISCGVLDYIFGYLIRGRLHFSYYFAHIILPEMLYTMLITIIIYPIIVLIYNAFEKREVRKEA